MNNVDDGLLISLTFTCDQQHRAVRPVRHAVLQPPNGFGFRPSTVRPTW